MCRGFDSFDAVGKSKTCELTVDPIAQPPCCRPAPTQKVKVVHVRGGDRKGWRKPRCGAAVNKELVAGTVTRHTVGA